MAHFTWEEMKAYWRAHAVRWSNIDRERDPDGLANACHPGAPLWLNRHYDRIQKRIFLRILDCMARPASGARALDIGCGAGRWSRILTGRGYSVVGIDLQEELIKGNRRRDPEIRYECMSLQDFLTPERFELVVSVTVFQHNPYEEQDKMIAKIAGMVADRGHIILLESTKGGAAGLFPRAISDWQKAFKKAGFTCIAAFPYDYSPFIRLHWRLAGGAAKILRCLTGREAEPRPETYLVPSGRGMSAMFRGASDIFRFGAMTMDRFFEPVFQSTRAGLGPLHCGFLFKAE